MLNQSARAADAPAKTKTQPNIVVILADDMGFSDIGCFGGEVRTPNLDKLAAGGVRMTQFYNMARCCPTRASLLTGLYPHQTGMGAMCQDLGKPGYVGHLNDRCATLGEVLGQAGYQTGLVGKWHLSHLTISNNPDAKKILNFEKDAPISPKGDTSTWPFHRGYQKSFGTIAGVQSFYNPWSLVHNDKPIKPGEDFYYTNFITDKSVELIDGFAKEKKPFYLYVAHTAPHWPMHAPEAEIKKYEELYRKGWDAIRAERYERLVQLGIIKPEWKLAQRETTYPKVSPAVPWEQAEHKDWEIRRMATYAAMIDILDQGVGKITGKLNELGIADNTLVLFMSDNGACAENVERGWYDINTKTRDGEDVHIGNNDKTVMAGPEDTYLSYGPLWANASNTPFRSFKHYTYEGGISGPFIAHWPAGIQRKGDLEPTVGHVIDIVPTCLAAAGVEYPSTFKGKPILPLEGDNLLPALRGEKMERKPLFWEHEGNRAVRVGDWKLVASHQQPWHLYNMADDRTEMNDLAASEPARVKELKALYDAWAQRCNVEPWPVRHAK